MGGEMPLDRLNYNSTRRMFICAPVSLY